MKKALVALSLAITFSVAAPIQARADFLAGVLVGTMISGDNAGFSNGSVIYSAPENILRNINDPLAIRMACVPYQGGPMNFGRPLLGDTIRQAFAKVLPKDANPDQFEILQVTRFINPQNLIISVVWFCYIEKDKIKLPPETKAE